MNQNINQITGTISEYASILPTSIRFMEGYPQLIYIKRLSKQFIIENNEQYFNCMCKNEYIKNKCPSLKENLNESKIQS
jgi:hypothetical protein